MGKQTGSQHVREIWAVALVGGALLLLLSLLSYDPYDVGNAAPSGRQSIHNFIGPVGAWIGYLTFSTWGLGGYVLMVVLAGVGTMLLLGQSVPWRAKVGAGLLFLIASACLLHLFGFEGATRSLNLPSAGGFVGMIVADFTSRMVGNAGTWIIFGAAYVISLILLINFQPSYWIALSVDALQDFWQTTREKSKPTVTDELREKERAIRIKELEMDRAVAKKEKEARKFEEQVEQERTPRPEPKIVDSSIRAEPPAAKPAEDEEPAESLVEKILPKRPRPPRADPAPVAVPTGVLASGAAAEGEQYVLPSIDLLSKPPALAQRSVMEDLKASAKVLKETLGDFGIEVESGDVTKGPRVTLFELYPAPGVKVEKISSLSNNIALAMRAEKVRILTPVPGKGTVGVEVPNSTTTAVYLRDILESDDWRNTKARIPLALGRDVKGHPIIADLADMPHMLIAGATGSGKTVCMNSILAALLYRFTAEDLRLVLIDPKMVEMQQYNSLPHLVVPVVTEAKKVPLALGWVIREMEKRYQIFAKVGVRNITSFNARPKQKELPLPEPAAPGTEGSDAPPPEPKIEVPRDFELIIPEKLPFIVVVVDELADLMHTVPVEVEGAIARLTALARAAGIHLIIATQRPSTDVVTGVIKSNVPARIAFQVSSMQDSRVILDANGADKLLGKGDMLYLAGSGKLTRAQGVLIADEEIKGIVDYISQHAKPHFEPEIHQKLSKPAAINGTDEPDEADEELVEQCVEVIRQTNRASVSILQRRLRIGYTRAARIMDLLEERGIVGPNRGAEPREILVDLNAKVESES